MSNSRGTHAPGRTSVGYMRTAVVTGATQGLGLALVEGLAARLDPADLVLLTGRDPARVEAAVKGVAGARARVAGRVLDVTVPGAVEAIVAGCGTVDIFIA